MQTSDRVLARRYAQAFFGACAKARVEETARQELALAVKALRPRLSDFAHPLVTPADKKKLLRRLLGGEQGFGPLTLRFLDTLVEKKRIGLLPTAAQAFEKIHETEKGLVKAQVRSALPLAAAQQEALKTALERFCGRTVQLELREDPGLLGGLVVRMGDWVLDRSLAGALARMRESLAA